MQQKNLKKLLLILFVSLASCATPPPDKPLCVEMNINSGFCVKIMSGETFIVDEERKYEGKTWWDMRPAMIQMPASTWKELKAWIIKMCKKTNQCGEEVPSWDRTVNIIDSQLETKTP